MQSSFIWVSYEKPSSPYCVMYYYWWGCRRNLTLITLGSERVNSPKCAQLRHTQAILTQAPSARGSLRTLWNLLFACFTARIHAAYFLICRIPVPLLRVWTTGPVTLCSTRKTSCANAPHRSTARDVMLVGTRVKKHRPLWLINEEVEARS